MYVDYLFSQKQDHNELLANEVASLRIWNGGNAVREQCGGWLAAVSELHSDWYEVFDDEFWIGYFDEDDDESLEAMWESLEDETPFEWWRQNYKESAIGLVGLLHKELQKRMVDLDEIDMMIPVRKIENWWFNQRKKMLRKPTKSAQKK